MANKAFEIQESKLRIGGVDLEAGTTGVVIPGVTQASTYFVDEVDERDGSNPSTFGSNASAVTVIDNAEYLVRSGTTPSGSYQAASYSVDELDDGQIEEINVDGQGVFLSADKTRVEAGNMWATTVANPFVSFNAGDWTQIPYRPKIRAGEITNIGGGGASSLEDLDDVQLEGPVEGSVLTWNASAEKWENRTPSGGADGVDGADGADGVGVPAGGTTGQVLAKINGTDYNTQWVNQSGGTADIGNFTFGTDDKITFPDGSKQSTAYITSQQYGYFNQLVHTGDNNRVDMEAVAMDSDGNSYISYSYYDDSESKRYGGIIKFNSLGVQQWSKNILSGNVDAEYVQIVSLEYVVVSSTPTLLALGNYGTNTNDVGFTYFIDPADGSIIPTSNIEFTSGNGMRIKDGVFSVDPSGGIVNALVVGETYDETLQKTFTPLAPSTIDKLYVSWTEFNASEVQSGSQLNYTVGGYDNVIMNGTFVTASPDGTGSGLGILVSAIEGGTYNIIRVNGWSGVISGWTSPQSIRVLGSNLGGIDVVNDFVFDFDPVVFNDNTNNITAAVSNKTGTPVSNVFCSGSGGRDWSTEIGNSLSFEYQLNNQAFISRVGGVGWSRNIGLTEYDKLHSVVVDTSSGDNYAVGYMPNGNNRSSLVIKHDIAGNQEWAVYIDPANNTGGHVTSVDLLADGNIITVDENGTVTKIDSSDGSIIWQVTIDDGPSWNNEFRGTATPDGGYILTSDEDSDYTMYVARISGTDGSVEWTKRITRTFGGDTGEIYPQDDYDAQYIDCNSTHVTIAATTYLNNASPEYAGIVINFPIDGENTDGIYGQYVISSVTLDWTTESTTSVAATVNTETNNVNDSSVTPTSSSSNLTVGKTNIGGGAEVTPPTSIVNGNSYANIATADGNLVIGVNNDNMTWTFATDRTIYGKADQHITIAVVDADDDDFQVRQLVVDGSGTEYARTQLQRDEFRIGLDFQGDNTSWTFNPTNFQVPSYKDSSIYSFGGNLTLYAMNDGSNGVARLQSVSNMNGPNVFSQFEATPTGANIKVYDGGSNGGTESVWTFGNNGSLTFPDATVQTTAYTGGAATGVSRSDDNLIIRLTDPENDGLELRSIVVNGSDADVSSTVLGSNGFIIRTNSNVSQKQWTFDNTGNLTLPQGTIVSETANTTVITPPGALAGQSLVIRLTGATGIISDHPGGFADGDTITLTVTPDYNYAQVTGTVDYTFTGCTSVELGRALTGTLTFTAESAKPISWTIPVSSTMTTFTITLSNASGFDISGITPLTLTKTGSSEDHHIHLIAGDPSITDIYLGDDDQYVKIEKNGGNVIIGTDTNSRQWTFDTNGNLTLPAGGDIKNSAGASEYISVTSLKTLVAASTDFADFQTRISAL